MTWDDLKYWDTGEWQVVEERLSDLRKKHKIINPAKENLFASLDACPYEKCKVMLCGQDPYPQHRYATGLAFSIPKGVHPIPPTLSMIFDEYESDLHLPRPKHGSLLKWEDEGVLLWNVVPSCEDGHSLSHDWVEWELLTQEIIDVLKEKGVVFIFLGGIARRFAPPLYDLKNCRVIEAYHPSPRANIKRNKQSNTVCPFVGSRIFSRTNSALVELGLTPVEWRLE